MKQIWPLLHANEVGPGGEDEAGRKESIRELDLDKG